MNQYEEAIALLEQFKAIYRPGTHQEEITLLNFAISCMRDVIRRNKEMEAYSQQWNSETEEYEI